MKLYQVVLNFAWPHERFLVGWEIIPVTEEEVGTVAIYLGPLYIGFDFEPK